MPAANDLQIKAHGPSGNLALPRLGTGLVLFAHRPVSGRLSPRKRPVAEASQAAGLGTIFITALALLCACAPPPEQSTGKRQTAASPSGVILRAAPDSVAAGEEVTLTLSNGTNGVIGYNLCASSLERRSGGGWQPAPEDRVCTMELRTLQPGDEVAQSLRLPDVLATGDYRYATTVERTAERTREAVASNPIRVLFLIAQAEKWITRTRQHSLPR